MLGNVDYVGLTTLVSAIAAAIVSILVAWSQRTVKAVGQDTNAKVTGPNGESIGSIIASAVPVIAANQPEPEKPK